MPEQLPTGTERRYGGAWQEMRAYVASVLIDWAMTVHPRATMDMAHRIADLEDRMRGDR